MNYMLSKPEGSECGGERQSCNGDIHCGGVLIVKEHLYWYQAVGGILIAERGGPII
ncbi:MAG: hypothetical protein ACLVJO_11295 [[Clostridium] scindens]